MKTAVDLIRADLEPLIYQLYQTHSIYSIGSTFLRSSYEEFGERKPAKPRDWMPFLSWGLVLSFYALIGWVVWVLTK